MSFPNGTDQVDVPIAAHGIPRHSNRNVLRYVVDSDDIVILVNRCCLDGEAYRPGFVWSNITNRLKLFFYFQ